MEMLKSGIDKIHLNTFFVSLLKFKQWNICFLCQLWFLYLTKWKQFMVKKSHYVFWLLNMLLICIIHWHQWKVWNIYEMCNIWNNFTINISINKTLLSILCPWKLPTMFLHFLILIYSNSALGSSITSQLLDQGFNGRIVPPSDAVSIFIEAELILE